LFGSKGAARIAVFISGAGSTLQALCEMSYQLQIALVVSNKTQALGLLKAKRFGISTYCFSSKNSNYDELTNLLRKHRIDRIFLAGYMKILPEKFVKDWQGKIDNVHPSLLPSFKGLNSAYRSWFETDQMGVSIHRVSVEMDEGPLRLQQVALQRFKNKIDFNEASIFLRRTEQHLLRDYVLRWF